MPQNPNKVELLAPAGSAEAFAGALSAGADAVYLGGRQFGARAYAENFGDEEILEAIGQAHVLGRKVYLTANVLTRESELPDLVRFVDGLYRGGLDGVIVQDTGVLAALRETCPGLPLHASTQLSVTSAEAVRYLQRYGICRVVPARELSIGEIRTLRQEAPSVEIEAFIHGAMCYSCSGRCLMSSFLGGRSGNRGRCAGTCRLPYRILDENGRPAGPDAGKKEVWPLSMKDLCVLEILPELIDAGIHSFKIEGRMKKPVYAAGVTAVYRKYIDRYYAWSEAGRPGPWTVEGSDLERLRSLYIRTELGTGYYHRRNGRALVTIGKPGYAGTDEVLEEEIRREYLSGLPKRPIEGRAGFRVGEPARLEVWTASGEAAFAAAQGMTVQAASGRPLDPADLSARLQKTGDSPFAFSGLEVEAQAGIFLPVSAVNALRREALQKLRDELLRADRADRADRGPEQTPEAGGVPGAAPEGNGPQDIPADVIRGQDPGPSSDFAVARNAAGSGQEIWALVSTPGQMEAAARAGCACIVTDGSFGPPDPAGSDPVFARRTEAEGGARAEFTEDPGQKTQNGNKSGLKSAGTRWICALPPVFRVSEREKIRAAVRGARARGFDGLLVRNPEELQLAKEEGFSGEIIADSSLYSWNGRSMGALLEDCGQVVCSLELSARDLEAAARSAQRARRQDAWARPDDSSDKDAWARPLVLPVYGRIPMMETAGCVRKTENSCTGRDGFWYLEDRMGKRLPVRCRCDHCSNTVYNAVPLSLHQFAGRGLFARVPVLLCMFTAESPSRTERILRYFSGLGGADAGAGEQGPGSDAEAGSGRDRVPGSADHRNTVSGKSRRRRGKRDRSGAEKGAASRDRTPVPEPPFTEFTNGHFRSGAL